MDLSSVFAPSQVKAATILRQKQNENKTDNIVRRVEENRADTLPPALGDHMTIT